jgi:hypothetical protein
MPDDGTLAVAVSDIPKTVRDRYASLVPLRRSQGAPFVMLSAETRVPEKYRLVDLETGEVWRKNSDNDWVRADDIAVTYLGGE